MVKLKDYTISLPEELVGEIDTIISESYQYTSRSEFIRRAATEQIKQDKGSLDESRSNEPDTFAAEFEEAVSSVWGTPSTGSVASYVGCGYEIARQQLEKLEQEGRLSHEEVGDAKMWKVADGEVYEKYGFPDRLDPDEWVQAVAEADPPSTGHVGKILGRGLEMTRWSLRVLELTGYLNSRKEGEEILWEVEEDQP